MLLARCSLWSSAALFISLLPPALGDFSYVGVANQDSLQHGDGTFYGHQQDQDSQAACSYSENRAGTMNLTWTTGAAVSLALNGDQFSGSKGCGLCVMYRGVGGGIGVTPISTTAWFMGFVNNICPECERGSLDQASPSFMNHQNNIDGDGRWRIEWYGVPCNVGGTKLQYSFVVKHYYWFELVVSNTRIPISQVSVKINGKWLDLPRSVTNTWAYYRENGDWQGSFPMPIRITSALAETLEDIIYSEDGNTGKVQFAEIPGPAYVSAEVPGRGIRPRNAFALKNGVGTVPNIGPIKGASAYGAPGWSNSSARDLTPQQPDQAPSTSSEGSIYVTSTFQVKDNDQCGGTGGECTARDRGQPTKPCIPGAWPLALCATLGSTCQPQSEERWVCRESPLAANSGSATSASSLGSYRSESIPSPGSSSGSQASSPSSRTPSSSSPATPPSSSPAWSPSSPSPESAVPYKATTSSSSKAVGSSTSVYDLASRGSSPSWSNSGSPGSPYSSSPFSSPAWSSSPSSPSQGSPSDSGKDSSYSPSSSSNSSSPSSPGSPAWRSPTYSPSQGSSSDNSKTSSSTSNSSSSSAASSDGSKTQYSASPASKSSDAWGPNSWNTIGSSYANSDSSSSQSSTSTVSSSASKSSGSWSPGSYDATSSPSTNSSSSMAKASSASSSSPSYQASPAVASGGRRLMQQVPKQDAKSLR